MERATVCDLTASIKYDFLSSFQNKSRDCCVAVAFWSCFIKIGFLFSVIYFKPIHSPYVCDKVVAFVSQTFSNTDPRQKKGGKF